MRFLAMIRRTGLLAMMVVALGASVNARAQGASAPTASTASVPVLIPDTLPLRRDRAGEPAAVNGLGTAATMLAVLGFAGIAIVWFKRRSPNRQPVLGESKPVALSRGTSQVLTRQASVHVVRWAGEELLLGCTPDSVTVLARRSLGPDREAVA